VAKQSVARLVGLGVVAGALSAIFGVGGGFLIVPVLTFIGMNQREANATSLAAVLPISAAASLAYIANAKVAWSVAATLVVGGLVGAEIGTRLLARLSVRLLKLMFLAILVVAAIRLLFTIDANNMTALTPVIGLELIALGTAIGVLSSLLGVGGGFLMVPAMMLIASMEPATARGTSLVAIIPMAAFATLQNHRRRVVDVSTGFIVGGIGAATSLVVATQVIDLSPSVSNLAFAGLLLVIALRTMFELRYGQEIDSETPRVGGNLT
jgi:uncharacterized protein